MPYSWRHDDCRITIDVVGPDVTEMTSFIDVFAETMQVLMQCVIGEPHLGGWVYLGERDELKVTVQSTGNTNLNDS